MHYAVHTTMLELGRVGIANHTCGAARNMLPGCARQSAKE